MNEEVMRNDFKNIDVIKLSVLEKKLINKDGVDIVEVFN